MKPVNQQTPIKADRRDDGSLLVHSIFFTIQGEGPNVGQPSVFVRLAGCNLQCPGCDTEYTSGPFVTRMDPIVLTRHIDKISQDCIQKPLIVITGGEPLRQNLVPLINRLFAWHYRVQIETNGTLGIDKDALSDNARYLLEIVCSPKTNKVVESLHEFIIAYKYVVNEGQIADDGMPETVLGLTCRPARPHIGYHKKIYIQPADENNSILNHCNLNAAIQVCKTFGHTLCLQTHKLIGLP